MPVMRYSINLVRQKRAAERRAERFRLRVSVFSLVSFGVLAAAVVFSLFEILSMQMVLSTEHQSVARIKNEYGKYKAARMIVDKADIELLDSLQNARIFWTRKLTALALHLPNNYCITQFSYQPPEFKVTGYGTLLPQQDQLITIDDFLNQLRRDSTWSDLFRSTQLNSTALIVQNGSRQASFDFSSLR